MKVVIKTTLSSDFNLFVHVTPGNVTYEVTI